MLTYNTNSNTGPVCGGRTSRYGGVDAFEEFVDKFEEVLNNTIRFLQKNRFFAVVIGDKYSNGEWIPLGFFLMDRILKMRNIILKSIVVKNFEETRAKRNQKELWRYRALVGGFYIFKHEYIFIFQKRGN